EISRIDLDKHVARNGIDALLFNALTLPYDGAPDLRERFLDEVANRMRLAGSKYIIVWVVLLHNLPHPFDIFPRVPPVAFCVEVPEKQRRLQSQLNGGYRSRDDACDLTNAVIVSGSEGANPSGSSKWLSIWRGRRAGLGDAAIDTA